MPRLPSTSPSSPFLGDDAQLKARSNNILFSLGKYQISELQAWLAGFATLFFAVSYWLSVSPGKLVDRVGKVLTPALLLSIAVLVVYAACFPDGSLAAALGRIRRNPDGEGADCGHGTMDALASLVFAIIVD